MARPLRLQYAGALYHVISRGNYRAAVFGEAGAKEAFLGCLFEACEKARWRLHGYVLMSNHYHLALETPEGNLSEGMRWLQSTYANRFNRFRGERGHVFQGRYKAILVEDLAGLGNVVHYIHLNPVRAKLVGVEKLREYQASSYWMLQNPKQREGRLEVSTCLNAAGDLKDTPAGRRSYEEYLGWLAENEPAQKQLRFSEMCRGWAMGGKAFKKSLVDEHRTLLAKVMDEPEEEAREAVEMAWRELVDRCLAGLGRKRSELVTAAKNADWKVAVASRLKTLTTASNPWLAEELHMGHGTAPSRYVGEMKQGLRAEAAKLARRLEKVQLAG